MVDSSLSFNYDPSEDINAFILHFEWNFIGGIIGNMFILFNIILFMFIYCSMKELIIHK